MLSLAELGIGSAIVYHLYEPLAKGEIEHIKRIMGLYRKCYRIIAGVCFIGGLIILPFVPVFVNGLTFSDSYLRFVFLLYVIQVSISYLFISDTTLLQADQKRYKTILLQMISKIVSTAASLLIFIILRDFVIYLISTILITVVTNILCAKQAVKIYPYLKDKYEPLDKAEKKEIFKNVRDIFVKKIAGYVTNSTDNLCISMLVGTIQVGYYSNYAMLFSAVKQVENQIGCGFSSSMGELVAKKDSAYVDKVLQRLTIYFQIFAGVMSAGLMACSTTFVKIWLGEDYVLHPAIVMICCINIYIAIVKEPLWQTMDAAGLFHYDRNLAIISTLMNLIISIVLGLKLGMLGIFIGTAISLSFEIVFKSIGIYRKKLKCSIRKYAFTWMKMVFTETLILLLGYYLSVRINNYNLCYTFIVQGCCAVAAALGITIIIFYSEAVEIFGKILGYPSGNPRTFNDRGVHKKLR